MDINVFNFIWRNIRFIKKKLVYEKKNLTDPDGTISIALGAYGVPETFLVNSKSKIIRKYIGPLKTENILEITKIIK